MLWKSLCYEQAHNAQLSYNIHTYSSDSPWQLCSGCSRTRLGFLGRVHFPPNSKAQCAYERGEDQGIEHVRGQGALGNGPSEHFKGCLPCVGVHEPDKSSHHDLSRRMQAPQYSQPSLQQRTEATPAWEGKMVRTGDVSLEECKQPG